MKEESQREEPQSDTELVALVEAVIVDVREGRITKATDVHTALEPLGPHIGPMGCTSTELAIAIDNLRNECGRKNI